MPLYPFILLGAVFLGVMILPPLVAAYVDYRRELQREAAAQSAQQDASNAARRREG